VKKKSSTFKSLLYYGLSLVVLLWPAIYNGYPIVYPDTGAYIHSGFAGTVPVDRPLIYGLFIRHISMLYTLWFVAIAQSLIALFLIIQTLKVFDIKLNSLWVFAISIFISSITTCGYYIGQIMPDVFTAYMWWSLGIIIVYESKNTVSNLALYSIVVLSSTCHLSNFLGLAIFEGILIPIMLVQGNKRGIRKILLIPFIVAIAMLSVNLLFEKKLFLSKTPSVFFSAKLNSTGILKEFLDKRCHDHNYFLCRYKDVLPSSLEDFLWGDKSVIEKIKKDKACNYDAACISIEDEMKEMNQDILLDKDFGRRYLKIWLQASFHQSYNFEAGDIPPLLEGSSLYPNITWHYNEEIDAYTQSKQSKEKMNFSIINSIQNYAVIISIIYIFISVILQIKSGGIFSNFLKLAIIFLVGYVINVCVCEFFSTPSNRFTGRMIWLFPLIVGVDIVGKIVASKSVNRQMN
jgi:hypothetical protein